MMTRRTRDELQPLLIGLMLGLIVASSLTDGTASVLTGIGAGAAFVAALVIGVFVDTTD